MKLEFYIDLDLENGKIKGINNFVLIDIIPVKIRKYIVSNIINRLYNKSIFELIPDNIKNSIHYTKVKKMDKTLLKIIVIDPFNYNNKSITFELNVGDEYITI